MCQGLWIFPKCLKMFTAHTGTHKIILYHGHSLGEECYYFFLMMSKECDSVSSPVDTHKDRLTQTQKGISTLGFWVQYQFFMMSTRFISHPRVIIWTLWCRQSLIPLFSLSSFSVMTVSNFVSVCGNLNCLTTCTTSGFLAFLTSFLALALVATCFIALFLPDDWFC